MKRFTGVFVGVLLILAGVLYFLDAFHIFNISFSLDGWWAFFLIVPCLDCLIRRQDVLFNSIGLAVGVLLLLAAQNVISYDVIWKIMFPVAIITFGIKLILRAKSDESNQ